jgi:hypothetical protein
MYHLYIYCPYQKRCQSETFLTCVIDRKVDLFFCSRPHPHRISIHPAPNPVGTGETFPSCQAIPGVKINAAFRLVPKFSCSSFISAATKRFMAWCLILGKFVWTLVRNFVTQELQIYCHYFNYVSSSVCKNGGIKDLLKEFL